MGAQLEQVSFLNSNYTYAGKELQTELDLAWQDYGTRCFDNWSGRWQGIDILAEYNAGHSPYSFNLGNSVRFSDPTGMISEDENGLMQVSTDLWGSERNQDFRNQSANSAQSRGATTQRRQAGYIESGSGSGVGEGQLQRDLTTYSVEFNRHAGDEINREIVGNGVDITYSGKSITRELSPDPRMLAALGTAATLYGAGFSFLSEASYFPNSGQFRNSKGQIKSIRQFFTKSPQYQAELSLAKTTSNTAKIVGNSFAVMAYGVTVNDYVSQWGSANGYPGHEATLRTGADLGVNTLGLINVYGAAANIGWEIGRFITQSNSYQSFKHNVVYKTPEGRDGLRTTDY